MIPTIDISAFRASEPGALSRTAAALREACMTTGFYFIAGHGAAPETVAAAFVQSRRFHALPESVKSRVAINRDQSGWLPVRRHIEPESAINPGMTINVQEAYIVNRERPADHPWVRARRQFLGPNQWPEGLPGFREAFVAYHDALAQLGEALLPLYATALGLEPGYFAEHFRDGASFFRALRYPSVPNHDVAPFGSAAHTDAGFLTFLPAATGDGLEVLLANGAWHKVTERPGMFLVNTGDTLRRWSNETFVSAPHRVVAPLAADRFSLAFGFNPHFDAEVAPLPTCVAPERPAVAPPTTYGDYYRSRIFRLYPHLNEAAS